MKRCFIDLETTGLDARQNAIIQIAGIIEIDGNIANEFDFDAKFQVGDRR